jgi:hypothetical protein
MGGLGGFGGMNPLLMQQMMGGGLGAGAGSGAGFGAGTAAADTRPPRERFAT